MTILIDALQAGAALAAAAGSAQAVAGALSVRRFAQTPDAAPSALPPVTVLKPLHGDEPLLEHALESTCVQDYPAYQIVFAVQTPDDPARAVAERLRARHPTVDIRVVVNPAQHGPNRKIGNLINAMQVAAHDIIVIADSDIHVRPDYLRSLVEALHRPGVGLATTLYAGLPADGSRVARLGATQITHTFLPGAALARRLGRQDCLGATMALRRSTLARIGGLHALVDHLADDNVLGCLVRAQGLSVALASAVPLTTVPEATLRALFSHELRWARTIRALVPLSFVASAVQYPLAWSALALALGPHAWTAALFATAWLARDWSASRVDAALAAKIGPAPPAAAWLMPLRDVLSLAVMVASYGGRNVRWRGHALEADPGVPELTYTPALVPDYAPEGVPP